MHSGNTMAPEHNHDCNALAALMKLHFTLAATQLHYYL